MAVRIAGFQLRHRLAVIVKIVRIFSRALARLFVFCASERLLVLGINTAVFSYSVNLQRRGAGGRCA